MGRGVFAVHFYARRGGDPREGGETVGLRFTNPRKVREEKVKRVKFF